MWVWWECNNNNDDYHHHHNRISVIIRKEYGPKIINWKRKRRISVNQKKVQNPNKLLIISNGEQMKSKRKIKFC